LLDEGGAWVDVLSFGAKGDGTTDDAPAFNKAFAWARALGRNVRINGGRTYVVKSTVDASLKSYLSVDARGATVTTPNDITLFDLHSAAEETSPAGDGNLIHSFQWMGGRFVSTAASKVAGRAFRAWWFRDFNMSHARIEGFWRGVDVLTKDTFTFSNMHTFNCATHLYVNGAPAGGLGTGTCGIITLKLHDWHFSVNGDQFGVHLAAGTMSDIEISGGSFNGSPIDQTDASRDNWGAAICVDNSNLTVSPFTISITGVHFEQAGEDTCYVWFRDELGTGTGAWHAVTIDNCSFTYSSAGMRAVRLERCGHVHFSRCYFAQGAAATPIDLDANCSEIQIDRSVRFAAGGSIVFACPRWQISMMPTAQLARNPTDFPIGLVSGYDGAAFSTGAVQLDMSALLFGFPTALPPLGYRVRIRASDSGSAAGGACWVGLARDVTEWTNGTRGKRQPVLYLDGVPDGGLRTMEATVTADAAGDIYLAYHATGADTLSLWVDVIEVLM
jgi:hypothetical protein